LVKAGLPLWAEKFASNKSWKIRKFLIFID
jgi:hypothetical protein